MTAPDELDVEWGIDRAPGDQGLLDSRWSQALANRQRDFLFDFPQTAPIVRTNLFFLSLGHQLRNVNLQKGRSDDGVLAASPMINSIIWRERRRRLRLLELHTSTPWGIFPIYRARFPNLRSYFRNKICFSLLRIILLRNKG